MCQGAKVPRCSGARVPRFHGASKCQGAAVRASQSAKVPNCQGAPSCRGAGVPESPKRRSPLAAAACRPSAADRRASVTTLHRPRAGRQMKYLCLVYLEEQKLHAVPGQRVLRLRQRVQEQRRSGCRRSASARRDRHDRAVARRQSSITGRTVCGDQGAARRLLSDRGAGPERRHPGRVEDSAGA